MNIYLIGPMGAGKTTTGKVVAQQCGMAFHDTDDVLEKRTGVDINWIYTQEGEEGFRERERKIIDELTQMRRVVLATGGGCVSDEETRDMLSARGYVVYLATPVSVQYERVMHDTNRPGLDGAQDPRTYLEALHAERDGQYRKIADLVVDNRQKNGRLIAKEILENVRFSVS